MVGWGHDCQYEEVGFGTGKGGLNRRAIEGNDFSIDCGCVVTTCCSTGGN
jgi:hypothetical protein